MSEQSSGRESARNEEAAMLPHVNVVEDANGITLYADLPGVPRDKLAIHVDGESLTVQGEIALAVPQGMESIHAEVEQPRYRRTFTLSRELDSTRIAADFRHGVLTLRIPKVEHAQPRKIEVRVD